MRRSRATDVSLGLIALLVNVAIVVAVVFFIGGRTESPPDSTPAQAQGGAGASPTSTATGTGGAAPDVSELLTEDTELVLAVLGDGTGDEDGEWVTVFADLLGASRSVTLHNLDPDDPTRYTEEQTYGESGAETTIWNASRPGAAADYPADRLDVLVPDEPDAVLLSYGRDDTASDIAESLDTTLTSLRDTWPEAPVAVILQAQNTDDEIAPVREAAAEWAEANDLPTIDVAGAFRDAGDPNSFVSVVDPPSVNAQGGRLWGETVFTALGGQFDTETPQTPGDSTSSD